MLFGHLITHFLFPMLRGESLAHTPLAASRHRPLMCPFADIILRCPHFTGEETEV